jgi:hypothetical protein
MKFIRPLVIASTLALLGSTAWADDAHHPEAAASAAKAPKAAAAKPAPARPVAQESLKKIDQQMMDMRAMHDKMANAKTPEERSALMAEHMKAMQGGMAMMGGMAGADKDSMKGGMPSDMATHHQMMEKRMEMMETMMQMMMDRLPPPAAQ